jgi:hypothetical protein
MSVINPPGPPQLLNRSPRNHHQWAGGLAGRRAGGQAG